MTLPMSGEHPTRRSVIIEIVDATLAEENGLGPLYRIEQRRDGLP